MKDTHSSRMRLSAMCQDCDLVNRKSVRTAYFDFIISEIEFGNRTFQFDN